MNEYDYIIDAFTRDGNNTNLEVDNLTVGCIESKNNNFSLDSNGNLTVNSITTSGGGIDFDRIYPVGSVYISVSNTNPGTLFGGTWEAISGKFLLAQDTNHAAGTTGGEENVTLTLNQMPQHNHAVTGGDHSHTANFLEVRSRIYNQDSNDCARIYNASYDTQGRITTDNGSHSHTVSQVGANAPHNNMPPYLSVYMWKRTL